MQAPSSAYYQGNSNTIESPVTQSGRVIINAQKDQFSIHTRQNACKLPDEHFHVLTHEIAFHDTERTFENSAYTNDSRVPVVTNLATAEPGQPDRFRLLGVVGSRALHNSTNAMLNEEDCTVQIGGICTVLNNSLNPIKVGDIIGVEIPIEKTKIGDDYVRHLGTAHQKMVARVMAFTDGASAANLFKTVPGDVDWNEADLNTNFLPQILGRSMSSAKSGDPFDLLLTI